MSLDDPTPPAPRPTGFERSAFLYDLGRYDLAESEARRALEEHPDEARAHAMLALCLARKGSPPSVVDALMDGALERDPEDSHVHYLRSQLFSMTGRAGRAEESARESLRLDPYDASYHAHLAAVLLDLGRPQESLASIEAGLALDAVHVRCLLLKSWTLLALGRPEESEAAARDALAANPESAICHRLRGQALLQLHRTGDALESFMESVRLDPTDRAARDGVVDSLRARIPLLGAGLRLFWRFLRLPRWVHGAAVVAVYVAAGLALGKGKSKGDVWGALALLMFAYGAVAVALVKKVLGWVFDFCVQFDPVGRRHLSRSKRVSANLFLVMAVMTLGVIAAGTLGSPVAATIVAGVAIMLPPWFAVARCRPGARRRWMIAFASWMPLALLGLFVLTPFFGEGTGLALGIALCLGLIASIPASLWIPPRD